MAEERLYIHYNRKWSLTGKSPCLLRFRNMPGANGVHRATGRFLALDRLIDMPDKFELIHL